jgi:hypothetical protein
MLIQLTKQLTQFVRPSDHSVFSPSAAEQWMMCPARRDLIKNIPSETSKYAEEGTLAHSVCEAVFRQDMYQMPIPSDLFMQMVQLSDRGAEMMESAHAYSSVLQTWLSDKEQIGDIIWWGIEKGIPVYPEKGCYGTADCVIVGTKGCAVIDFKYGKGKEVSAYSLQLKVYLAGVILNMSGIPDGYNCYSVIFQPRITPVPKQASYNVADIKQFANEIWEAITLSEKGGSPVEGNHCYWCPAKRTNNLDLKCPLIKERPLKLAQENFGQFLKDMQPKSCLIEDGVSEPDTKRDEAMMKILALAPLVAQIAEDAEGEFMARLQDGEYIPGLMITESLGNRKINAENDQDAAELIKQHFNIDALEVKTVTKLKTITQIEKIVGKNKLDSLCVRPVKKKLKIMDEKTRNILGEMQVYGSLINDTDND